jgi:hypothetical protein
VGLLHELKVSIPALLRPLLRVPGSPEQELSCRVGWMWSAGRDYSCGEGEQEQSEAEKGKALEQDGPHVNRVRQSA